MLEAIKNRRSVRFYRDTPVSDEQIEELFNQASSAMNAMEGIKRAKRQ